MTRNASNRVLIVNRRFTRDRVGKRIDIGKANVVPMARFRHLNLKPNG